ncbi:PLAC8 motif-containing protein [Dillenia turbinata]|uniref:PLAC8 motif-containing protein n=1 Tax=Dillenia turbinata TaxID=194707 RepID=A0AAN8YZ10_9MAGN
MADSEKEERERVLKEGGESEQEKERFMEGVAVLDFDMLCSTVALQTQGKWRKLERSFDVEDGENGESGGLFRMWEGELLDCFEDRRIGLESSCCPCYRFGKNMRRAGFGHCIIQGIAYLVLAIVAIFSCIAFIITWRHAFLYLAVGFSLFLGTYLGFFRTQIRKKFNIRMMALFLRWKKGEAIMGSDNQFDDCIYHLLCPCCTLSQESRTLEMNNVQDGTWHGRGDTICIGSSAQENKAFFELKPPPSISIKPSDPCSLPILIGSIDHSQNLEVQHHQLSDPPAKQQPQT